MKSFTLPVIAGGAIAAAALGLAGAAGAAPSGATDAANAAQTVSELQAQGFDVIVSRIGTAPLDQCTVDAVRPGMTFSRMDSGSGVPGATDDIVTTGIAMTVYVIATC